MCVCDYIIFAYMAGYDMIYIYIYWYDMIWYDIYIYWYDMMWYDIWYTYFCDECVYIYIYTYDKYMRVHNFVCRTSVDQIMWSLISLFFSLFQDPHWNVGLNRLTLEAFLRLKVGLEKESIRMGFQKITFTQKKHSIESRNLCSLQKKSNHKHHTLWATRFWAPQKLPFLISKDCTEPAESVGRNWRSGRRGAEPASSASAMPTKDLAINSSHTHRKGYNV